MIKIGSARRKKLGKKLDIETSGRHVGAEQNAAVGVAKLFEDGRAVLLRHGTVQLVELDRSRALAFAQHLKGIKVSVNPITQRLMEFIKTHWDFQLFTRSLWALTFLLTEVNLLFLLNCNE